MSYAQSESVQQLSKTVFGQKHRLAVMAAIAQSDGLFNPTEMQIQLGFTSQSFLQSTVADLVSIGLLSRQHGDGRVYYRRNPHSLWAASLDLLGQALAQDLTVESTTG